MTEKTKTITRKWKQITCQEDGCDGCDWVHAEFAGPPMTQITVNVSGIDFGDVDIERITDEINDYMRHKYGGIL